MDEAECETETLTSDKHLNTIFRRENNKKAVERKKVKEERWFSKEQYI